uniref:Lactate dehydrogenase (Fragments) n=1 Tax=Sus scrofa domesticus TaxID=9825 RepID=Q7M383_PIG
IVADKDYSVTANFIIPQKLSGLNSADTLWGIQK